MNTTVKKKGAGQTTLKNKTKLATNPRSEEYNKVEIKINMKLHHANKWHQRNTTTNKDSTNKEQMLGRAPTFSSRSLLLDHVWTWCVLEAKGINPKKKKKQTAARMEPMPASKKSTKLCWWKKNKCFFKSNSTRKARKKTKTQPKLCWGVPNWKCLICQRHVQKGKRKRVQNHQIRDKNSKQNPGLQGASKKWLDPSCVGENHKKHYGRNPRAT